MAPLFRGLPDPLPAGPIHGWEYRRSPAGAFGRPRRQAAEGGRSAADPHLGPHLAEAVLVVLVAAGDLVEQLRVAGEDLLHGLDRVVPGLLLLVVDLGVVT